MLLAVGLLVSWFPPYFLKSYYIVHTSINWWNPTHTPYWCLSCTYKGFILCLLVSNMILFWCVDIERGRTLWDLEHKNPWSSCNPGTTKEVGFIPAKMDLSGCLVFSCISCFSYKEKIILRHANSLKRLDWKERPWIFASPSGIFSVEWMQSTLVSHQNQPLSGQDIRGNAWLTQAQSPLYLVLIIWGTMYLDLWLKNLGNLGKIKNKFNCKAINEVCLCWCVWVPPRY